MPENEDPRLVEARGEAVKEKQIRQEIQAERDALKTQLTELSEKYGSLEKEHGKVSTKLAKFESDGKRAAALDTAIKARTEKLKAEGKEFKVNKENALKYISKGEFNEKTIDADIEEAFGMFGGVVEPPEMKMPGQRPAGEGERTPARASDVINGQILDALGRGAAQTS